MYYTGDESPRKMIKQNNQPRDDDVLFYFIFVTELCIHFPKEGLFCSSKVSREWTKHVKYSIMQLV